MATLRTHYLQSDAWRAFQTSLKRKTLEKTTADWYALAIVEQGKLGRRLYCPYGPTLRKKESLKEALDWLRKEAKARNLDFVRIEPLVENGVPLEPRYLQSLELRPSQKDVQPKYTIQVNLQKTADEVIAAMSQTTRNLYRNIHKKGVSFSTSDNPKDMHELIKMLKVVAKRTGMTPHSDYYLQTEAETLMKLGSAKLFIASQDDKPIAMALVYCDKSGWYYSHAASYETARKLHIMQPLVAYIIMSAHAAGAPLFDLYGITPPDAPHDHPLVPITKFKRSFGGDEIHYSGTWELPIRPVRYRLYRLLRAITRN